ncbi:hypothetical protein HK099_007423 [Clydaea vesicula]|uniref:trimethyllysine dioxygenase n=1 Tax=Clydaea vesicula TaxID=447962 RepID=A0AAD5TWX9_9FUNG|nr:hypothetical protein HK099_007423 [Clydaea vesicula]
MRNLDVPRHSICRSFTSTSKNVDLKKKIKIDSEKIENNLITLKFSDNFLANYQYFWLRDHCQCEICYHTVTKQRLLNTFKIPLDITPKTVGVHNDGVTIIWNNDNHESNYSIDWLRKHSYSPKLPLVMKQNTSIFDQKLIYWDSRFKIPSVSYQEVMETDEGVLKWLNNIRSTAEDLLKHPFILSCETNFDKNLLKKSLEYRLKKNDKKVEVVTKRKFWDFTADLSHEDTAYTNLALSAHTDTTYFTDPIGVQIFHLLRHDGNGGKSLYVDGFHCANILKKKFPMHYETLSTLKINGKIGNFNAFQNFSIFEHDKNNNDKLTMDNLVRIKFNNDDRDITDFNEADTEKFYLALREWMKIVYNENNELWINLKPGTVIAMNNWRVFHGRSSFDGIVV